MTDKKPHPRVAICMPSGETILAKTCISIVAMVARTAHHAALMPINLAGADTAEARNAMAEAALNHGAEWLLWIDPDMMFPPDSLQRLLAHDKEFVAAEYRKRAPPYDAAGGFTGEDYPETGLVERPMVPLGLCLIKSVVFRALSQPYFTRTWQTLFSTEDNPRGFTTEDTYICAMARHAGFGCWVDMDLTKEVSHLGTTPISWSMGLKKGEPA